MSLTRAPPKAFQSRKFYLMSKAHELSSSCNSEVLLIVGRKSQYSAYSSFDRAESIKTVLSSNNTKILRPSDFEQHGLTVKDPSSFMGEYPTRQNLTAEELKKRAPHESTMSIDYLCTSPVVQTGTVDQVSLAPAKTSISYDGRIEALPNVQRPSTIADDTHRPNDGTLAVVTSPLANKSSSSSHEELLRALTPDKFQAPPQAKSQAPPARQSQFKHSAAMKIGQKKLSGRQKHGLLALGSAHDATSAERQFQRRGLAKLKTNLPSGYTVPEQCELSVADASTATTSDIGAFNPVFDKDAAIQCSQFKRQCEENRSSINTQDKAQKAIQAAEKDYFYPVIRPEDSPKLHKVVLQVDGENSADPQAKNDCLSYHDGIPRMTIGETAAATHLWPDSTGPESAVSSKRQSNYTSTIHSENIPMTGRVTPHDMTAGEAPFHDAHYSKNDTLEQVDHLSDQLEDLNEGVGEVKPEKALLSNPPPNITAGRPFTCTTCGRSFKRSYTLKRHRSTHTYTRPFECFKCPKRFARHDSQIRHQHKVHESFDIPEDIEPQTIQGHKIEQKKRPSDQSTETNFEESTHRKKIMIEAVHRDRLPAIASDLREQIKSTLGQEHQTRSRTRRT